MKWTDRLSRPNLDFMHCGDKAFENADGSVMVKFFPSRVVIMEPKLPMREYGITACMTICTSTSKRDADILNAAVEALVYTPSKWGDIPHVHSSSSLSR